MQSHTHDSTPRAANSQRIRRPRYQSTRSDEMQTPMLCNVRRNMNSPNCNTQTKLISRLGANCAIPAAKSVIQNFGKQAKCRPCGRTDIKIHVPRAGYIQSQRRPTQKIFKVQSKLQKKGEIKKKRLCVSLGTRELSGRHPIWIHIILRIRRMIWHLGRRLLQLLAGGRAIWMANSPWVNGCIWRY